MIIGPSIGWMFARGVYSPSERKRVLKFLGSNALEVPANSDLAENTRRMDSLDGDDLLSSHNSFHLANYDPSRSLEEQVVFARKMLSDSRFSTVLIHPIGLPEKYFEGIGDFLERRIYSGMSSYNSTSFAIENMDGTSSEGTKIEELERLLKGYPELGLVFDVQHAYEQDETMGYAEELFLMGEDRIRHFHVSGNGKDGKEKHGLLYKSQNRDAILNFLNNLGRTAPVIVEGQYANEYELSGEIDFLKRELV